MAKAVRGREPRCPGSGALQSLLHREATMRTRTASGLDRDEAAADAGEAALIRLLHAGKRSESAQPGAGSVALPQGTQECPLAGREGGPARLAGGAGRPCLLKVPTDLSRPPAQTSGQRQVKEDSPRPRAHPPTSTPAPPQPPCARQEAKLECAARCRYPMPLSRSLFLVECAARCRAGGTWATEATRAAHRRRSDQELRPGERPGLPPPPPGRRWPRRRDSEPPLQAAPSGCCSGTWTEDSPRARATSRAGGLAARVVRDVPHMSLTCPSHVPHMSLTGL